MTKKEVMDYVTETPQNVNKNILGQKLDEFQKNVSWNDLKDKPFYTEMVEKTIDQISDPTYTGYVLDGFPTFAIGDTVTVKVDGVEYSLVAFDDDGAAIGDAYWEVEGGTGRFGWRICSFFDVVLLFSNEERTVSIMEETVHPIEPKYLPEPDMVITLSTPLIGVAITKDMVTITSGTVEDVNNKILAGELVDVRIQSIATESGTVTADEIKATAIYYGGRLIVCYTVLSPFGGLLCKTITIAEDGTISTVQNKKATLS